MRFTWRQQAVSEDLAARVAHVERRVAYMEGHERKRSTTLLLLGSVFGLLGFAFAFTTGFMKYLEDSHEFKSGMGYFPPTVSEMVHDPKDPAGKAFFAFEFIGALFIFLSWYPWELRNVYLGDDDIACCRVSWVMLRQFIPAPGMMLLATVTTTPTAQADIRDWFTICIHLTGAMMMFVGYVIIEGKTLGWFFFSEPMGRTYIGDWEKTVRKFFLNGVCFWYVFFFAVQGVLLIPNAPICCADEWGIPPGSTGTRPQLLDTATGLYLLLKVLSYVGEVVCGVSLICSHLTIWYFCSERHIDLEDELTEMGAADYQRMKDEAAARG